MKRWNVHVIVVVLVVSVALAMPAAAASGTPEARTATIVEVDGDVEISVIRLHDPLPPGSAPHPAQCDYIEYLRYRMVDGPEDPQQSDAVMVGAPGAWLGAYSLDRLARNTLRTLAADGKRTEWWSVPRRSVCAFDLTGLKAANRARDGQVAFGYYYEGKPVDGKTFAGWQSDYQLRYLAEIGLANNVHDIHEVLLRGLPDPEFRRTKVLCGGHSDGGLIMGAFGAWDFGDGQEEAGFNQCAGFFAVDSLIISDAGGLQEEPRFAEAARLLGSVPYPVLVAAMKAGVLPNTYNGSPIIAPETMALQTVLGSAAYYHPDAESDLHRRLPRTPVWEGTERVNFPRTHSDFVTAQNGLRDFRFTNEALLGVFLDDNSLNFAPMHMSLGAISGGALAPKEFPWPDDVTAIPGLGYTLGGITGPGKRVGPTDKQALYTWRNYDQVADVGFTAPAAEVVDSRDLERQLSATPGTMSGWLDPYYTLRYSVDLLAAYSGVRSGDLEPMKYDAELQAEPIVTIFGTKSWTARTDGRLVGLPEDTIWVEGYTHIDPITGAAIQNNGKPEPVSGSLARFVTSELSR